MPSLSEAFAAQLTFVPLTVEPLAGAVIDTVGGVLVLLVVLLVGAEPVEVLDHRLGAGNRLFYAGLELLGCRHSIVDGSYYNL